MLGIRGADHERNEEIGEKTKAEFVIERTANQNWSWLGHVAIEDGSIWTKYIAHWRPRRLKKETNDRN